MPRFEAFSPINSPNAIAVHDIADDKWYFVVNNWSSRREFSPCTAQIKQWHRANAKMDLRIHSAWGIPA